MPELSPSQAGRTRLWARASPVLPEGRALKPQLPPEPVAAAPAVQPSPEVERAYQRSWRARPPASPPRASRTHRQTEFSQPRALPQESRERASPAHPACWAGWLSQRRVPAWTRPRVQNLRAALRPGYRACRCSAERGVFYLPPSARQAPAVRRTTPARWRVRRSKRCACTSYDLGSLLRIQSQSI